MAVPSVELARAADLEGIRDAVEQLVDSGVLDASGARASVAESLHKATTQLESARSTFLELFVLVDEMERAFQNQDQDGAFRGARESAEIHSAVADAVAVASTRLPEVAPDSGAGDRPQDAAELAVLKEDTLLGLDPARIPEAVLGVSGEAARLQSLQAHAIPRVERSMLERITELNAFLDERDGDSQGPSFHDGWSLPATVTAVQRKAAALETSAREYEEECESLADASLRAVTAALADMVRFVANVRTQRARAHSDTWVEFAGEYVETLLLKLRIVERQCLSQTYTRQSVPALLEIEKHLDEETRAVRGELSDVEAKLRDFEAGGDDFRDLATEFEECTRQLAEQRKLLAKASSLQAQK